MYEEKNRKIRENGKATRIKTRNNVFKENVVNYISTCMTH